MLTPRSVRARSGAALALGVVMVVTSCGKSSSDDDDDDSGGRAGDAAGGSGGGSSASGGSSQSATGGGGTSESGGAGRAGGTAASSGGPDSGGGTALGGTSSGGRSGAGVDGGGVNAAGADDGGMSGESGASGETGAAGSGACSGNDCTSTCGDGAVTGGEACDDGNHANDDGCSSTCTVEDGYTCTAADCTTMDGKCVLRIPAVFRDFNGHAAAGGHPDFEPGYASDGAVLGLVQDLLDADGKPVQSTKASSDAAGGYMHGQAAFAQWYRDGAPASQGIPGELVLWDDGDGGYVSRWGKHGEQWRGRLTPASYGTVVGGLAAGLGCSSPDYPNEGCVPGANQRCYDPCTPWGSTGQACCADIPEAPVYDGTPLFFPIDGASGVLNEARGEGKVPGQYGWTGVPWESDVATDLGISTPIETSTASFPSENHNFHFTSELEFSFVYTSGSLATFDITGDDDVWMFLNGHLAIDLGGWHVPLKGTLTIADTDVTANVQVRASDDGSTLTSATKAGTAASYGLVSGKVYRVKIFHAERQIEGSTFRFGVHGLNVSRSTCLKP